MTVRRRIVGYIVQPIIVDDDGENLTPVEVQPVQVPRSEWANVVELTAAAEQAMLGAFAAEQVAIKPTPNRATRRANGKAKSSA